VVAGADNFLQFLFDRISGHSVADFQWVGPLKGHLFGIRFTLAEGGVLERPFAVIELKLRQIGATVVPDGKFRRIGTLGFLRCRSCLTRQITLFGKFAPPLLNALF
jgi:hypothetical protein